MRVRPSLLRLSTVFALLAMPGCAAAQSLPWPQTGTAPAINGLAGATELFARTLPAQPPSDRADAPVPADTAVPLKPPPPPTYPFLTPLPTPPGNPARTDIGVAVSCLASPLPVAARILIVTSRNAFAARSLDNDAQMRHAENARLRAQASLDAIAQSTVWVEGNALAGLSILLNERLETLSDDISKKTSIPTELMIATGDVLPLPSCPFDKPFTGKLQWESVLMMAPFLKPPPPTLPPPFTRAALRV